MRILDLLPLRFGGQRRMLRQRVRQGLRLGQRVHVGPLCFIDPSHCSLITIGDDVTIGPRVTILAHDASTKHLTGKTRVGAVTIGHKVFVGAGTIILPGVTIGESAVIGAGSVVTRDVPPHVVTAGNPAKVLTDIEGFVGRHQQAAVESARSYVD